MITGLDSVQSATGNPSSYTVSSGSNRWLVAFIHWREADGVDATPSLSWGGQSMTRQEIIRVGTPVEHGIALFVLNEAGIDAGSGTTLSLSWDNAPEFNSYGVRSIQDADQTILDSDTNSSSSSTQISLSLTGANNGFCLGGYTLNDNFSGSFTWNNSFTELYDFSNTNQRLTAGEYQTTGNVTIDADHSGTVYQSVVAGITFSPASVNAAHHHEGLFV